MAFLHTDEFFCSDHPVAEEAYIQLAAVFSQVRKQNQSEYFTIEKPQMPMEGTLQKERQISVDPVSMKESRKLPILVESPKKESGVVLPGVASPKDYGMPPLPLPPGKSRFVSYSLPGSPASSPKFSSAIPKKKPHSQALNPQARQHSVALSRLAELREKHLERSKSCGESRISAVNDEFDLWLTHANSRRYSNPSRTETRSDQQHGRQNIQDSYDDDNFKCGAMCMFLPSFGKGKPVRSRKELPETPHMISRSVSLEKFECASWSSSALMHENGNGDSSKFFDLPLELIQCSENDANLPVRAAFVFEKDRKGVMKNAASRVTGRKSHESSRHVRFSSSSHAPHHPTSTPPSPCITPRLLKAREDFNAFIEAQSA
ncbi:Cupredoxin superfamily protein [Heracleum sosnowskyi]|uniref:Cupredoxin superfamily protein n=1 Tax=Heracleum sosnowskyi TaxID=360622 RepID=A0AAD8I8E1_9APIA|nr:Cupredoxin superfamily protein [Heracleum sosnowskyi]